VYGLYLSNKCLFDKKTIIIKTNMSPKGRELPAEFFERMTVWLKSARVPYRVIEHASIDGTASGSSATSGTRSEQGAKALIMMVGGEKPIMVVVRGPDRVDYKAVKRITKSQNVRLAKLEEIGKVTPLAIGTLPPFGDLFGITTYVDQQLLDQQEIACGTGLATRTLMIRTDDFRKVARPLIGNFAKQ